MMDSRWRWLFFVIILEVLSQTVTGLEATEGESLTLTCPRPSTSPSLPVVWQGPPGFIQYTRGLDVSVELSADRRSRLSLSGDHSNGYYNLNIASVQKSDSGHYRCLIGRRVVRKIKLKVKTQAEEIQGLFPDILNLATRAQISTNATCGLQGPEYFCKLVEHVDLMPDLSHCDYCNDRARSGDPYERGAAHPIQNAIDGSNRWWQSPSITNGREFNYVTITLDLGLIYQVAYIIVKAANAPRPGNWILEKSLDGVNYEPWQFFGINDDDCMTLYNTPATPGKPSYDYLRDDEVRCTSYFSKLNPLENGEIFVSLTNGRPGIYVPSKTLLDFTSARYVRLRLQKIRTLNADLMSIQSRDPRNLDPSVTRRYFYSIKDISVGGQCICYGHAMECKKQTDSDRLACVCQHNTCGDNCQYCCPLFNQKPWQRGGGSRPAGGGTIQNGDVSCEECNCHGHADSCVYNATVDRLGLSLNMNGEYRGGGVCVDCKDSTTGINCEKCLPGYYRPWGVPHNSYRPCRRCNCAESVGSTGVCVIDDSRVSDGLMPGDCVCKPGYSGSNCDQCALGYFGYPVCQPCPCNVAGTIDPDNCEGRCECKVNVEGANCEQCKPGYYDLNKDNTLGCRKCFCFGVTSVCQSAGLGVVQVSDMRADMDGWTVITLDDDAGFTLFATATDGWLEYRSYPAREQNALDRDRSSRDEVIYYWQAPFKYYGNRLASYGGQLHYTVKFSVDTSAPWQYHLAEADVVLQGDNITVTNGRNYIRENTENKKSVELVETNWYRLDETGKQISQNHVTRREFMTLLYDLKRILIRATHHTAQDRVLLKDVFLDTASAGSTSDIIMSGVEKCSCPRGYSGLSCESCDIGWRRIDDILYGGTCIPCDCYGHSKTCDPYTGRCLMCTDHTQGVHCDTCSPGYYGDPTRGTPEDCKPCACPLTEKSNNFATSCVLKPTFADPDAFQCLDCARGYAGERCERCDLGYYGYPGLLGNYCQPCDCNGNIDMDMVGNCDPLTGQCLICLHNTEGDKCEKCMLGYYGTAVNGDCRLCSCDPFGSTDVTCDSYTGQCQCKEHYTGRQCDRCEAGFGDTVHGCNPCNCSRVGSLDFRCHPVTGQCVCRPGVTGLSCDRCQEGFYGYSTGGCYDCRCYQPGANKTNICDIDTGKCNCLPNVYGEYCDSCEVNYWGLELGKGCVPCDCNHQGSYFDQCNSLTGQCRCKTSVTGQKCDECIEGYYGLFSLGECRECEPCDKPGHICHPETGDCVCPPNTMGERCELCIDTYYGYDHNRGCKPCDCDPHGSFDNNCDPLTGQCACKLDYKGTQCDSCLYGFYGFPDCTLCLCSVEGTNPQSCNSQGACRCANTDGQCDCKANTMSRTCSQCTENSFSLDTENPSGCTECFCFERSQTCTQASYVWTQVSSADRSVTFDTRATKLVTRQRNGFYVIPEDVSWTRVPGSIIYEPVYWSLSNFTGDQTLSYNGDLTFTVMHGTLGNIDLSDVENLINRPLVVLIGHGIPLMYLSDLSWEPDTAHTFTVKLHENYWKTQRNGGVSRKTMMIILQNVTDILVRASWDMTAANVELSNVNLDRAVDNNLMLGEPALGIEQCECPSQYSGLSCQNPADGYFRVPKVGPIDFTDLIGVIGTVEECNCNQHSGICDPETGICQNCDHNTAGDHCDVCAPGYYGTATLGTPTDCQRCACPLEVGSNNFSPTCEEIEGKLVCTACEEGYVGDRCEFCADGYYGDPSTPGGSCQKCNCNPEGSVDLKCDFTGRCVCLPGIVGVKCDQCEPRHAVVQGTCVSCDEGCTRELMSDMDQLNAMLDNLPFNLSDLNISVPFGKLRKINEETKQLKEQLDNLRFAEVNRLKEQLDNASMEVDGLTVRSEDVVAKSNQNDEDAGILLSNATNLEAEINQLYDNVERFVNDLEEMMLNTFYNKSRINTTAALEEAKQILKTIKGRDFKDDETKAFEESRVAELLSDRVKMMSEKVANTSEVDAKYMKLTERLDDLLDHIESSVSNSEQTDEKVKMLRAILEKIKEHVNETLMMEKNIDSNTENSEELLKDGDIALEDALENTRNLERRVSTLDAAIEPLTEKEQGLRENINSSAMMVEKAWAHANNLSNYATELEEMFAGSRSAAEDPLRAARVYDDIAAAILEAEEAAKKAKQDSNNAIHIADLDQLKQDVEDSLTESNDLLVEADETGNRVNGLNDDLTGLKKDLNAVGETQEKAIDKNQNILDEIDQLPTDLVDRISNVKKSIYSTETEAAEISARADQINEKVDKEMMPKITDLQKIHSEDFEDIRLTLGGARTKLDTIKNLTDSLDLRYEQSRKLNSDVGDKLRKLKQSILEAREEANKVKTSLKSDGQCIRKFPSKTQPGTINTISFAFKTNEPNRDMLFLLIQNNEKPEGDNEKEFLAVELRQGKVRFSWNNGGGMASIDHDLEIKAQSSLLSETERWYKVIAESVVFATELGRWRALLLNLSRVALPSLHFGRKVLACHERRPGPSCSKLTMPIGRLGRLTVHSLAEQPDSPRTKTSAVGFSVMTLGNATEFYVSGVPAEYEIPPSLTRLNFTGCMGGMYIDDQPLGLYNFEKTAQPSCMACLEVPSLTPTGNVYTFDGSGYAVMDKVRMTNPIFNSFALDFSTYWENATLLFVGNMQTGEYMSLSLENGHVVFQFYLGEGTYGRIQTDFKYNRNKWVSVTLLRNGFFGILEIDRKIEEKLIEANQGDYLLNVKDSFLNFGGLPADIDVDVFEKASGTKIVTDNFLGCMKSLQVGVETVNLWEGKATVGVTEGCKDSGLRLIGFYGEGFAEYAGFSLDTAEADLSISFSTTQRNALLLLAKDINGDSFYSLSLVNGRVEGWFSGISSQDVPSGDPPVMLTSTQTYNDGYVHNIAVKKTNRRINIYVDDTEVAEGRLKRNFDLLMVREDGGLYLGGVPEGLKVDNMAGNDESLDGCLSDIVIRGNVLNINKPKQYDKADIGRCSHARAQADQGLPSAVTVADAATGSFGKTSPAETSPQEMRLRTPDVEPDTATPPPSSCADSLLLNSFETGAYSFGEERTSFLRINITKKELRKVQINFDFRTYYKNGLLLYLSNKDQSSFFAAQLRRGIVLLTYENRGKVKEVKVNPAASLTDGQWHIIEIQKNNKRVILTVDGTETKSGRIAKKLKVDVSLFVGGLPSSFVSLVNDKVIKHSIRGCIRNVTVNDDVNDYDFVRGVDRCYSDVEKGAHFTGNSYAILDEGLSEGTDIDVSLEFRTHRSDGLLLMVDGNDGSQVMVLELHQGQVQLSVKTSAGKQTVESSFNTEFHLCDRQWHKLHASFVNDVIRLQVDDGEWEITSLEEITTRTAAVIIGGLPGSSGGFEGCMKKVKVQGGAIDWFDLTQTVNIHKTACPVT